MKKRGVFLVTLAILLTFGMAVVSCSDDSGGDSLTGTWVEASGDYITCDNGSFTAYESGTAVMKGSYSISGASVTFITNQINGAHPSFASIGLQSKWYSRNDFSSQYGGTEAQLNQIFPTYTGTVNGKTLTIQGGTFTKS